MKIKPIKIQFILVLALFLLLPITVIPSNADVIPVNPLKGEATTFDPTVQGNSSLYIIPSDFNGTGITYSGNNSDLMYTSNTNTGNTVGYGTGSVTDGQSMTGSPVSNESRVLNNPFFKAESLPRLVNITANDSQLLVQNPIPLSLHMGQSMTFFFNESLQYYALINTNDSFFLDVNVINPNAKMYIDLMSTQYPAQINQLENKLTIPIIPDKAKVQSFRIFTNNNINSIVSITPLPISQKSFSQSTIKTGEYYSDTLQQGTCYDIQNNPVSDNIQRIMDLKFFQFPVEAGKSYQIYYYHKNLYDNYNQTYFQCQIGSLDAVTTDYANAFNYRAGSLTNDISGLIVNPKSTGYVNITLIATGLVKQDYGFYFKSSQYPVPKNVSLTFNKPVYLKDTPKTYYTFNTTQPEMVAINYTSTINMNLVSFIWSVYDPSINNYKYITVSDFNAESGNLLNDSIGDLYANPGGTNYNWVYLPSGDYRLDVYGAESQVGLYQFNSVPVQTFTTNISLTMNSKSLYAVQLPLNRIDYNLINASSIAHGNVSVNYEYAIIGKYSFLGSADSVSFDNGNFTLGNREVNGNWTAYPSNSTNFITYIKPTKTNFVPILLIRPYSALAYNNNNTQYVSHNFTTTLTISSNVNYNNTPYGNFVNYLNLNTPYNVGSGTQLAVSGDVTTQKTVLINDDRTTDNDQVLAFSLATNPSQLYNVTIYLEGNYSTGAGFLNATFQSNHVWVHSGNFMDATVFGYKFFRETNTSAIATTNFLSFGSHSYLFVDLVRRFNTTAGSYENATLRVVLTPIPVKTLDLYSVTQSFDWNSTISTYEIKNTKPLWNITSYTYPGSSKGSNLLVPLLIASGLVVIAAAGAGAVVYVRKRRS